LRASWFLNPWALMIRALTPIGPRLALVVVTEFKLRSGMPVFSGQVELPQPLHPVVL
jgi:hypothetical protein